MLECEVYPRIVLPSPNGSTIATALLETGAEVAVGCLRNAQAVAEWLTPRLESGQSVVVIAAGERWSYDDSLRPALEDHLGVGAILWSLAQAGHRDLMSPEAAAAVDVFTAARNDVGARMAGCVGGRELASTGFAADVSVATALNSSTAVPVLAGGLFGPAA